MTQVGRGGVSVTAISHKSTFERDYRALDPEIQKEVDEALEKLLMDPRPPGIRFEKLQGHRKPAVYTIHATGNFKISFEIDGSVAILRRCGKHDYIDRKP